MIDLAVFPMMTETETSLPVFMHATGYLSSQYPIDRPDGFPYFQWIQCIAGEGEIFTEGCIQTVREHQVMFLFPNQPHRYHALREPWEVYWMILGGYQIETIAKLAGIEKSGVYTIESSSILLNHLKNAYSIAQSGKGLVGLECAKLTYMLMMDMIRYITFGDNSFEQKYVRLQPVFKYIEENYHQVIKLTDLSQIMGITSQHLCLLFRNILKMRPMEYVNLVRINKSKEMLCRHREKKIYEIARMVGFETYGYYCNTFRKIEGITPEAFRRLNGVS
jgi:AraC family transcriptional regulator of arabinose operon